MYVCKQTFYISQVRISQKAKGVIMWNLRHIIFYVKVKVLTDFHICISVPSTIFCKTRSSHPEVFLGKGVLKIRSKFTGEHPPRSVISIKLLCNFIWIALRHGSSPVNLLPIFRTSFFENTSGRLLLQNVSS